MKKRILFLLLGLTGLAVAAHQSGVFAPLLETLAAKHDARKEKAVAEPPVPIVSVISAGQADFVETVPITGSFAAREEILVAPEVDGMRVLEIRAEVGDRVKKGDVLAVLVTEQIEAQIAANDAALASATAAIARAENGIAEQEARVEEAEAQLERARPLVKSKDLSEAVFDQRMLQAKTAKAQLASARSALAQAKAEKAQIKAQRRELDWRHANAKVRAPTDGIVSRRSGRVGGIATASALTGGDTMFRLIQDGEIEFEAEVPETHLWKVKAGQEARIAAAGGIEVTGTVRIVSPEVDKETRLGAVRIFIGDRPDLKIGGFGRGTIETSAGRAVAVPLSAVLYADDGVTVQVVRNGKIATRAVKTGHETAGRIAIESGVAEGELVVVKAGTFLRDGDAVRARTPGDGTPAKVSEAGR